MIRRKHFGLNVGYDISTDLPFGFTLALGHRCSEHGSRYRFIISFHFDWPKLIWYDEAWMLNEPGTLKGLPLRRPGIASSAWTGRRWSLHEICWPRSFYWVRL